MSSDEAVFTALSASGFPGARIAWGIEKPQKPRFVYRRIEGGEAYADNRLFALLPRYRATLQLDEFDQDAIDAFAEAVAAIGPYTYGEDWDEDDPSGVVATFDFQYGR